MPIKYMTKLGDNMDLDSDNFDNNKEKQIKIQEDLVKLMKVLDGCIDEVDKFYLYVRKKQILSCSNDN